MAMYCITKYLLKPHPLYLFGSAPFKEVENSLLKTAIMMIGEFEFDSIFNESGVKVFYPHAAYIIFICFVIVMSIIIMNLLVGLAVDDIKGVQEQAVLTRKGMQVELALAVEAKLPEFITRKNIQTEWKVKPNASADICSGLTGAIFSRKNFKVLVEALNPELDDIEKVMEEQERLKTQLSKVNTRTKELAAQNERMQTMLQALLTHNNIDFTDVDHADDDHLDLGAMFNK
ncbi:hypothetical protein EB796_005521 [Bugula neritina]|uniref:Ion transport domain-containing protein n=1 Tax=Bugula neritina TaxID=10212 RepID=A0A7J7KFC8_BUGNE|nr:hypothetical protein EB796_005521 [Bugula neritina]